MGDLQTATSYEVVGKLADGDVAELFLAKASGPIERLVALKRIPRRATQNVELVKSFLDEAFVAARLQHPNIAQVFEVGKLGGSYFFAMEYVNGETLRALIEHARAKKIQVPIRAVVTIAAGAAAGLHHAHDRYGLDGKPMNLVHADVSPTNVLVSRDGIVKLVDFGIARARGRSAAPISVDKVCYWSPEQCRGDKLDRRSDLFSLGTVLWELLTLEDLYHRGGDAKTRAAIEHEAPVAPSTRRYDVPPELDELVVKLLAKDPADRFQDAGELAEALDSVASKLAFQLSTAELARMMRLWFGNVPEPIVPASDKPLVVRSEPVTASTAIDTAPAGDPIDELLDTVRNATEAIRAAAATLAAGTQRISKITGSPPVGDSVDQNREDFAAIRDRILAEARKKKETRNPPLGLSTGTPIATTDIGSGAVTGETGRAKRETLNSATNAYSFITNVAGAAAEPTRKSGVTQTPPLGTAHTVLRAEGAPASDESGRAKTPTGQGMTSAAAATVAAVMDAARAKSPTGGGVIRAKTPTGESARMKLGVTVRPIGESESGGVAASEPPIAPPRAKTATGEIAARSGTPTATFNAASDAVVADALAAANVAVAGFAKPDAPKVEVSADASETKSDATAASSDATSDADTKAAPVAPASDEKAASTSEAHPDATSEAAQAAKTADSKSEAKSDVDSKPDAKAETTSDGTSQTTSDAKAETTSDAKAETTSDAKAETTSDAKVETTSDSKAETKSDATSDKTAASTDKVAARAAVAREISQSDDVPPPGRPAWVMPAVFSALVLVVILFFALRGGDSSSKRNQADEPTTASASTSGTESAAGTADQTAAAGGMAGVADAALAVEQPADAAEVVVAPVDAALQVAVAPVDAAIQVAAVMSDAAVERPRDVTTTKPSKPTDATKPADVGTKPSKPTDATKPKEPRPPKEPTVAKEPVEPTAPKVEQSIEDLVAAGNFAKANKACKTNTIFNGPRLTACTIAACNVKDSALAKRWIRAIERAARADLIKSCNTMGVPLEDPSAPQSAPAP